MNLLLIGLFLSFLSFDFPDSANIPITNKLEAELTSISYMLPLSDTLHVVLLDKPILPNETNLIRVPYGYINKMIFQSSNNQTYFEMGISASTRADTVTVSLAQKEFGAIFERIYGNHPIPIQNNTDVPIKAIHSNLNSSNILNGNILLPGEILRIWVDKDFNLEITTIDIQDNSTSLLDFTPLDPDSIQRIETEAFFNNGLEIGYTPSSTGTWVINEVTLDKIILVEAFSVTGEFIDGIDCTSSPLELWDRVFIQHTVPIGFLMFTDSNERTYSSNTPDSLTNSFIISDLNLDFGFAFPE